MKREFSRELRTKAEAAITMGLRGIADTCKVSADEITRLESRVAELEKDKARLRDACESVLKEHYACCQDMRDLGYIDGIYLKPSLLELLKQAMENKP